MARVFVHEIVFAVDGWGDATALPSARRGDTSPRAADPHPVDGAADGAAGATHASARAEHVRRELARSPPPPLSFARASMLRAADVYLRPVEHTVAAPAAALAPAADAAPVWRPGPRKLSPARDRPAPGGAARPAANVPQPPLAGRRPASAHPARPWIVDSRVSRWPAVSLPAAAAAAQRRRVDAQRRRFPGVASAYAQQPRPASAGAAPAGATGTPARRAASARAAPTPVQREPGALGRAAARAPAPSAAHVPPLRLRPQAAPASAPAHPLTASAASAEAVRRGGATSTGAPAAARDGGDASDNDFFDDETLQHTTYRGADAVAWTAGRTASLAPPTAASHGADGLATTAAATTAAATAGRVHAATTHMRAYSDAQRLASAVACDGDLEALEGRLERAARVRRVAEERLALADWERGAHRGAGASAAPLRSSAAPPGADPAAAPAAPVPAASIYAPAEPVAVSADAATRTLGDLLAGAPRAFRVGRGSDDASRGGRGGGGGEPHGTPRPRTLPPGAAAAWAAHARAVDRRFAEAHADAVAARVDPVRLVEVVAEGIAADLLRDAQAVLAAALDEVAEAMVAAV